MPEPLTAWLRTGVVLLLVVPGCRTIEGTTGIPPFYEYYPTPSSIATTEGSETFFRPFGSLEHSELETTRLRILMPFLDFRWGQRGKRFWVLPLYLYRSFPQPFEGEDVDWMLFPLLYGGRDPQEGSYFAVFPLGGKIRGILGKDEIVWILFPLYVTSRDRERHSLHVLWPFYNRVWGGDWSGSRLWPFYGRYRSWAAPEQLRYDRWFVLWPFYNRRRDQLNVKPTELTFYFPFYGTRTNDRTRSATFLWPFFLTHYDSRYDRRTYAGYLFPFRIAPGQTDIWPFFGTKKLSRSRDIGGVLYRRYRHYTLWPIERYEWSSDGLEESTRFWLLPLFWHFHYIDQRTLETRTEVKLWPLAWYRRHRRDVALDIPSPLWFQREDYDRFYARWFSLFRYRWKEKLGGWELLYGAVMYRRDEELKERVFSVLGGLFECGTREGGLAFRLLWVPWW